MSVQFNSLQGPTQPYVLEEQAEKIKELRRLSPKIKVSLFVCRTEDQPLPIEAGKRWLSGDIKVNGPIPPDRIHLRCDFTDEERLKTFHELFDEVVIDQSSVKFLMPGFIS